MHQVGFGAYQSIFEDNRINGKLLLSLTKLDLKTLRISKLGHRLRYSTVFPSSSPPRVSLMLIHVHTDF